MNDSPSRTGICKPIKLTIWPYLSIALAAGLALAACPAQALNLLQNPGFEVNSGHFIPTSWTRFAPPTAAIYQPFGNYWVEVSGVINGNLVNAHSGNAIGRNGALLTTVQTTWRESIRPSAALRAQPIRPAGGSSSTAVTSLGRDCYIWLQVEFLDSSTNLLALYKSANFNTNVGFNTWFQYQVTNACDLTQPVSTGDPYFQHLCNHRRGQPVGGPNGDCLGRLSLLLSPVHQRGRIGVFRRRRPGTVNRPDSAATINNLNPQNEIFVAPSNGVSFNVSSPSGFTINNSGIHLVLNGTDVSASLAYQRFLLKQDRDL